MWQSFLRQIFEKIHKYHISWKSVQWERSCSLRTDGQTYGHEVNSRFSQLRERAYKQVIPVIIGATETIWATYRESETLRSYRKQPYCALHTAGCANVKVQNIFNMGNNMTCCTDCKYRTAATLYMYRRDTVCFRYIIVNTACKGWWLCWWHMIHLLTAIGLTPSGSSAVHIYTQTVHRTTQWNRIHRMLHNNKNT
jgi:hypothetical protein